MSVSGEIEGFIAPTLALVERALNWDDASKRPFWLGYALLAEVGRLGDANKARARSRSWADEWLLAEMVDATWRELNVAGENWHGELLIALSASAGREGATPLEWLNALLADDATRRLLNINNFEQTLWFNAEGAQELMAFLREAQRFEGASWPLDKIEGAMNVAGFRVVRWMEEVRSGANSKSPEIATSS